MDVFALRNRVVDDYRRYIESFVRIRDKRVDQFVREEFASGKLWPDPILQLNPAYEPGPTLDELAASGVIELGTAKFFRKPDGDQIRLYRHQHEAIEIGRRWEPFVVTTGTGSGKSLTYLVPIYDHILRTDPEKHQVRAIIVYPMNALINSQFSALDQYAAGCPESPIRYARYTGQDNQEARDRILEDPPHILLTNYVMLEYMLLRPAERVLTERATAHLEFLVLDELHTYRGRQGADVAMLLRRVRERTKNPRLLHIGTSATMITEGKRDARRRAVADVATKLFGAPVKPENVVDETLQRAIQAPVPEGAAALSAEVESPVPDELAGLTKSPLAAWIEHTFGLAEEGGRLIRRPPIRFQEGVKRLSRGSGLSEDSCTDKLREALTKGNALKTESGEPLFAFRLHQFLAAGGTVYATLEPCAGRQLSLEGQYYAPGEDKSKLLFPLVFCRECGQEYYMVSLRQQGESRIIPRTPLFYEEDDDAKTLPGYLALNEGELWSKDREDDLPDHWWDNQDRIKRDYRPHVPQQLRVGADGTAPAEEDAAGITAWFQPSPFMLCLRCGMAYDRREKNDFRKLTRLSHTGRSTATTLISGSAIMQLRRDVSVSEEAQKLLSFTDNRQDASLQAGHFNDFVQVALVRSALYKALQERGSLDHATITQAVFNVLNLSQRIYAKEPSDVEPGKSRNEQAMLRLLEYLLYEDLRRGWRIVQPNLEQCGLLKIEYPGLHELCENDSVWAIHPVLKQATPAVREWAIHTFLDHLRHELSITVRVLDPQEQFELRQRVQANLRDPWAFDDDDSLRESSLFVIGPGGKGYDFRSRTLSARSKPAQFLRAGKTWGLGVDLGPDDWQPLLDALIRILQGNFLARVQTHTKQPAIQLLVSSMRWALGDGTPLPLDPIRTRRAVSTEFETVERAANRFFAELYRETARLMAGVEGQAHTGQVPAELRVQREDQFRSGQLSALFCSPTMELGIDIRDLNVVHLRNIPPTPANYAQRSGRAGRSGQPALVAAFCSEGSPHDQYFFQTPDAMVAGAVAPPRLDLGNEELVQAHIQSVWLAATGINLRHSMAEVLDLNSPPGYPLQPDPLHRIELSPERAGELGAECHRILESCGAELKDAFWYVPGWLDRVIHEAKSKFDEAFQRWRELYTSALRQRDEARKKIDDHATGRGDRRYAEQEEREAKREIDLLLNRTEQQTESDFYPYRYLAAEGFLPGYNFPRLPLRAMLPAGDNVHMIDRPRLIGLAEFGPRNILYHEGRKYRVSRCILPSGGVEGRLKKAKFCLMCGYFHDEPHTGVDICDHCKTPLTGETSEFSPLLFEMPAVRGKRVERITCDEEERTREGYELDLHYRFATKSDGTPASETGVSAAPGGEELFRLFYGPQATLWRINRGWRRSDHRGFRIDSKTGFWTRKPGEESRDGDIDEAHIIAGVIPFVRDTRNVLLIKPSLAGVAKEDNEAFLASLGYALQRGCQFLFQLEEQEVGVGRIGDHDERRIILWEAAEGGSGIWPRLLEEQGAMSRVARDALLLCHFDPVSGEDTAGKDECSRACYRCLLSYRNQLDHRLINRFLVRDLLLRLQQAVTTRQTKQRDYQAQYEWLEARIDPNSSLEASFLAELYSSRHRLPDLAQYRPEEGVYAEADFFYERDGLRGVAVFIDGPHHDDPIQREKDTRERRKLEDLGYRVIVIRYDKPLAAQITQNADVFGPGLSRVE